MFKVNILRKVVKTAAYNMIRVGYKKKSNICKRKYNVYPKKFFTIHIEPNEQGKILQTFTLLQLKEKRAIYPRVI